MPGPFPERKTATHLGPVGQFDFQDIREDDFGIAPLGQLAKQVGSNLTGSAWVHLFLALAPSRDPILVHHPAHPVLAHLEQSRELAMA